MEYSTNKVRTPFRRACSENNIKCIPETCCCSLLFFSLSSIALNMVVGCTRRRFSRVVALLYYSYFHDDKVPLKVHFSVIGFFPREMVTIFLLQLHSYTLSLHIILFTHKKDVSLLNTYHID